MEGLQGPVTPCVCLLSSIRTLVFLFSFPFPSILLYDYNQETNCVLLLKMPLFNAMCYFFKLMTFCFPVQHSILVHFPSSFLC